MTAICSVRAYLHGGNVKFVFVLLTSKTNFLNVREAVARSGTNKGDINDEIRFGNS
jgi:hypothetical protein